MPLIRKCCCCGLRAGVMVLGWLGLVGDVTSLISAVLGYSTFNALGNELKGRPEYDIAYEVHKGIAISAISFSIIGMITNIMLLFGISQKNRLLLLPWLVSNFAITFLLPILIIIIGLFCFFGNGLTAVGIGIYVIGLPISAFLIFCWLCVLSLYQKFSEEESLNKRRRQEEIGFLPTAPNATITPPSYDHYNKV